MDEQEYPDQPQKGCIKEVKAGRGGTEGTERHCSIVQRWDLESQSPPEVDSGERHEGNKKKPQKMWACC